MFFDTPFRVLNLQTCRPWPSPFKTHTKNPSNLLNRYVFPLGSAVQLKTHPKRKCRQDREEIPWGNKLSDYSTQTPTMYEKIDGEKRTSIKSHERCAAEEREPSSRRWMKFAPQTRSHTLSLPQLSPFFIFIVARHKRYLLVLLFARCPL